MTKESKLKTDDDFSWKNWRQYGFPYLARKVWRLFFQKEEKTWFDERLLAVLRCPVSQQSLHWLSQDELPRLQAALEVKALCNCHGDFIQGPIVAGLVRKDGKFLYWVQYEIVDLTKFSAVRLFWQ